MSRDHEHVVCCLCGSGLESASSVALSISRADGACQTLWSHHLCLKNHLAIEVVLISDDESDVTPVEPGLVERLAVYTHKLSAASQACRQAAERPQYEARLAGAARMFEALRRDSTCATLLPLIEAEQRALGWSYFSEAGGAEAERACSEFATAAKRLAV